MKCYDCENELTEKEEEFGLCKSCEDKRSNKQLDDLEEENAHKEMTQANNEDWQKEFSRSGGLKKSEKKTTACRKNASKPRARWVTAIYFQVETPHGIEDGLMLQKGLKKWDLVLNGEEITKFIEEGLGGQTILEILEFATISRKI